MTGLVIDAQKCRGCGRCVRACANGALEMVDRVARVGDACILCGLCVDSCRFDAIELVREERAQSPLDDYRGVWVFAQTQGGAALPVARELLGQARKLADARGCEVTAVLACDAAHADALDAQAAALVAAGADRVLACADAALADDACEAYAAWLCALIEERKPEIVLFGATVFGREVAPCVAARVRTGLTADCTELAIDAQTGLLQQTRPTFGGNLMATIVCPRHRPQMATVRPGVLAAPTPDEGRAGTVERVAGPQGTHPHVRVVERLAAAQDDSVADSELLVVVGRGIGAKKNLALARRLAELLGADLGCSRPLVEQGWLEYPHQVGQTGVSVSPRLLVSVGVSGAIQHLAGIGGAECVVAINSDPEAPIHSAATYSVVGDCVEVLKELIARLEAR